MGSPSSSPPLLYLTDDDDDDNEIEHNISYENSLSTVYNDIFPHKKRKFTNTNVRVNPSIVNWSKRQRNDDYYQPQTAQNFVNYEPDGEIINPNKYIHRGQNYHSFHAFDWSTDVQTPAGIYPNPIQTTSRVSFVPPSSIMNAAKRHLDRSDAISLNPMTHQNDRYIQQPQRKLINIPITSTTPPLLPLPLPSPTSSIIRPTARRLQPEKNIRLPFTHSAPPLSLPVHHSTEPVFQPSFRPPSPALVLTPTTTPEIRRQPLNGTGILSAFYDSKCYQCNICKFKSVTSSTILQHIFTHIFFCPHCSFYTYSNHSLCQHTFEKHNSTVHNDIIDPKTLDLLYITRCSDGKFALCMDTSPPPPLPPPPPPPATAKDDKPIISTATSNKPKPKRKTPRKKTPKQKKEDDDDDIVILSEKHDINPRPSSSIAKRPTHKEKQTHTYVLMKHRRCYSIKNPPCFHSLTLEYNICREHTIRHMCQTQGILKRLRLKPKLDRLSSIDEVAKCLKTIVNNILDLEEKRDSPDLICPLPNNIINLIFSNDNLDIITHALKLNNKYETSVEQNEQNKSEYSVRTSNQHNFILSSSGIDKNEQSIFASLHTSVTIADSIYTRTNLAKLPVPCDNTSRFLKGDLNNAPQPTNSTTKPAKKKTITQPSVQSTNPEPAHITVTKSPRRMDLPSPSPIVDRNNNSVTSPKPRVSLIPNVIVLD